MDKNRIRSLSGRPTRPTIAKPHSHQGPGGQFDECAVKAVSLASGGLRRVRKPRTERVRKDRHRGAEVSRGHSSRHADEGPNRRANEPVPQSSPASPSAMSQARSEERLLAGGQRASDGRSTHAAVAPTWRDHTCKTIFGHAFMVDELMRGLVADLCGAPVSRSMRSTSPVCCVSPAPQAKAGTCALRVVGVAAEA